jgi:hypothetical protein
LLLVVLAGLVVAGGAVAATRYPPVPIGVGAKFRIPATPAVVLRGRPVGGLRCTTNRDRIGVHLELFARGRVLIVPPGVGVAAPRARDGAYVRPLGCTYPIRTLDPTGVIEVHARRRLTLGDFFDVWGQALSKTRLAGFSTTRARPVRAYVAGRRWRGSLRAIPLRRHGQIVVELGAYIRPHTAYPAFRSDL